MATQQTDAALSTDDSAATVQRLMDQYTEIARLAGGTPDKDLAISAGAQPRAKDTGIKDALSR